MPKPIRLHGKKVTETELFAYILKLIDDGITGTSAIAGQIGKDERTVRRYLIAMSKAGKITLNSESGRLVKTTEQDTREQYLKLELDDFGKISEIASWIKACEARSVEPYGIRQMLGAVRSVFDRMKTHPKAVCYSKKVALEFWANFVIEYKKETGRKKVTQHIRTAFRNFLDSHDISFGHGMAKGFGLGSEHDSYMKFAGAHFKPATIEKLGNMITENKDEEIFLALRLGVRTGGRIGALVTMTWDRIYFDQHESFENKEHKKLEFVKLEQHETKDKRGYIHLGKDGEWKTKFIPLEEINLLLEWKKKHPEFRRFLFFEDTGSDLLNRKKAYIVADRIARKLSKYYYPKIENEVDPLTREYMYIKPTHIFRHTQAQLLKNAGFSDEEISKIRGDRSADTVKWYCTISTEQARKIGESTVSVAF